MQANPGASRDHYSPCMQPETRDYVKHFRNLRTLIRPVQRHLRHFEDQSKGDCKESLDFFATACYRIANRVKAVRKYSEIVASTRSCSRPCCSIRTLTIGKRSSTLAPR